MQRALLSPFSALVAHIEPVLRGARVLLIGSPETRLADHVLSRGAAHVLVLSADPAGIESAKKATNDRRIDFSVLVGSTLPGENYDLVLVENLGDHALPEEIVRGARAVLRDDGFAVVATENDDVSSGLLGARRGRLDYDTFNTLLEDNFEGSVLLAQSPFIGYALVDLSAEGPISPSLDNGFLHGAADVVDHFVAIAGPTNDLERFSLPMMSIVQFEAQDLVSRQAAQQKLAPSNTAKLEKALKEKDAEIARLLREATDLEARAQKAEREKRELAEKRRTESKPVEVAPEKLVGLEKALEEANARIADLESDKERFERDKVEIFAARRKVEKDALDAKEEIKRLTAKLKDQEDELYDLDDALREVEEKLKDANLRIGGFETKYTEAELALAAAENEKRSLVASLASLKRELEKAATSDKETRDRAEVEREIARFEDQLRERARVVSDLERSLGETGAYAATLRAELDREKALRDSGNSARSSERDLEELGRRLAEKEADLVAAEWTIGTLQKKLASEKHGKNVA